MISKLKFIRIEFQILLNKNIDLNNENEVLRDTNKELTESIREKDAIIEKLKQGTFMSISKYLVYE